MLNKLFGSSIRTAILTLLFGIEDKELYIREIERLTGFAIRGIQKDLTMLESIQLITSRKDGNRLYFKANKKHPIFADLKNIILKTTGLVALLKTVLVSVHVDLVFIFGSIATGEEKPESDIDLFIVGDLGLRKIASRLREASEQLGREINPHIFTVEELLKRLKEKDRFVKTVMESKKIFVIGNDDVLKGLVN